MTPRSRVLLTAGVVVAVFVAVRLIGMIGGCASGRCRASVDAFDARMRELARTDPRLLAYKEGRPIPTGFRNPRGIAAGKDGRIDVAGDRAVKVFLGGVCKSVIGLDAEPYCVSVAEDSAIYTGMIDHVEVIGPNGVKAASWKSVGGKPYLTSVAASTRDVWVADAGNRVVLHYSPAGQLVGTLAGADRAKNAPGLIIPSPHLDVVPAGNGEVWVSDSGRHRLELYSGDGKLIRFWGKDAFSIEGFSGCCNPTDFALLPDGKFVTAEKGLPRVKVYRADGSLESVVAGVEAFNSDVTGLDVATDSRGRIFVLDPASRCVRVFVRRNSN